jgi:hypothetical protein
MFTILRPLLPSAFGKDSMLSDNGEALFVTPMSTLKCLFALKEDQSALAHEAQFKPAAIKWSAAGFRQRIQTMHSNAQLLS